MTLIQFAENKPIPSASKYMMAIREIIYNHKPHGKQEQVWTFHGFRYCLFW